MLKRKPTAIDIDHCVDINGHNCNAPVCSTVWPGLTSPAAICQFAPKHTQLSRSVAPAGSPRLVIADEYAPKCILNTKHTALACWLFRIGKQTIRTHALCACVPFHSNLIHKSQTSRSAFGYDGRLVGRLANIIRHILCVRVCV